MTALGGLVKLLKVDNSFLLLTIKYDHYFQKIYLFSEDISYRAKLISVWLLVAQFFTSENQKIK